MSYRHLGQYKGNFYIMDEVLVANLSPTKTPLTRMRFQIDPPWFARSNVWVFIIVFIVSISTRDENATIS